MLERTYQKLWNLTTKYKGYLCTQELLKEGFTNRQIAEFVKEGYLEKVAHGHYWLSISQKEKPKDYKALEVCRSYSGAVICADSACYYQGLIEVEPKRVSVATVRTERGKLSVTFPVTRHYYGEEHFTEALRTIQTEFGTYRVYDIDRSVCECVRFRKSIEPELFELIIERYHQSEQKQYQRLLSYAKALRVERLAKEIVRK